MAGENEIDERDFIRLKVTFKAEDVNLRELSSYLALIDRCFGRLVGEKGLTTYSRRRGEQAVARTIHAGSIEIDLIELATSSRGMALVAVWMLLKHLSSIVKALPEGAKQLAEAYSAYEDGRLKRENRRQIGQQIQRDPAVQALDKPAQEKLVVLLERLLERESSLANAAERFSDDTVKALDISIVKKDTRQSEARIEH